MQRLYALLIFILLLSGLSSAQADEPDSVESKLFKVQLFLAKSGDPAGQYYLAEMYEKGLGTPQDLQQALVWYKKSAELGNAKAEEKLANWDKNLELARKAKERADADAKAVELGKLKRQEEAAAEAAAKAKARATADAAHKAAEQAKAAELAKAAAQAKAAELAKAKQEADAAAKAKAHAAETARKAPTEPTMPKTTSTSSTKSPNATSTPAPVAGTPHTKEKTQPGTAAVDAKGNNETEGFTTNPCKGPQAKFLSTCQ